MGADSLRVAMADHPQGMVNEGDFLVERTPRPAPGPGQALVRVRYLSLDPYMRPMMNPVRSYVEPLKPGQTMPGATVGEVVESNEAALPVGAHVACMLGWQEYGLVTKDSARIVELSAGDISLALHVLGMTGATAHYGLLRLGEPKPGETVVVTAASGAVGSVAGQLAKIKGCRVIGIAGGPEKCRYVTEELGFDACLDHRTDDIERQLAELTPDWVDILFENVGGPTFDAILPRMNDHGRIVLCGNISDYNRDEPYGVKGLSHLLLHRVDVRSFVIADHRDYWPEAIGELAAWVKEGRVRFREDIAKGGLEGAPAAFVNMLTGRNFGKQLIEVAPPSADRPGRS
ncbi:NADP-dependent oxidoreductase [Streptomyces sp. B-S-A8]|uniref:NADP-dependent oxidoreductase n=1 Tax=Streptomyces solicavernae TaxID=3043614 RepID=A0ABT6RXJ6_9ACTN|nr:NADP-dependent oxidoreductase [Streptomyces sp. B-S-A8]MDI3389157.1 NADP-dependent oxidoreductase [Streptomyces sp. B-S-A8]